MRILRPVLAGLLALLWVLLSSHCTFESLPGLGLFSCQTAVEHASGESHGCDEECCPMEYAAYRAQRHHDLVPHGVLLTIASDHKRDVPRPLAQEAGTGHSTVAPPEFLKTWQFLSRTALPARAPSIVS